MKKSESKKMSKFSLCYSIFLYIDERNDEENVLLNGTVLGKKTTTSRLQKISNFFHYPIEICFIHLIPSKSYPLFALMIITAFSIVFTQYIIMTFEIFLDYFRFSYSFLGLTFLA